jgi:glycosyltransferase 2 family protein
MKGKLIFFGSLLLGIVLTVVIYLSIGNLLAPFKNAPLNLLFFYILTVILIQSVHTLRWKMILKTTDHNIPFRKLFVYRIMGYSLNYITPTAHIGGEPLRAAMLKENNVPYSEGVSSIFIDKSMEVLADGFFAIAGIIIIILSFALPKQEMTNLILASILCFLLLLWLFFNFINKKKMLHFVFKLLKLGRIKKLKALEETIIKTENNIHNFFLNHKPVFRVSVLLSLSMWIFMFLEYKLLFLMLGFDATLLQLFIIISFVGLAYAIPIPAALGVLEIGQLTAFSILNLPAALGITAAIVIRAKDLIVTIIGLILISIKGLGTIKTIKEVKE